MICGFLFDLEAQCGLGFVVPEALASFEAVKSAVVALSAHFDTSCKIILKYINKVNLNAVKDTQRLLEIYRAFSKTGTLYVVFPKNL